MENRARNESAFNQLLMEIQKRSPSYFESATSDLRKHYENTNPFYLFSNQFHELILKISTQLEHDKKVDVRKCVKDLLQELTFYKIACPLKHLRLADSNIPNLFTSLRAKSWPDDIHQKTSEKRGSFPGVTETKDDVEAKKAFKLDAAYARNIASQSSVSNGKASESSDSYLLEHKTLSPIDARSIEAAFKSVPKGASTIINLKIGQQNEPLPAMERSSPPTTMSPPNRDGDSVSKRKIGEIVSLKEEEISRKKTSNGQNLIRVRKPVLEKITPLTETSKGVNETIYIIDDEDEDVIVKSCSIPSPKATDCKKVVPASIGIIKEVKAIPVPKEKIKVNSKEFPDDDVFIVEELNAIPLRRDLPTVKKAPRPILPKPSMESADDVVILDCYDTKPKSVQLPTLRSPTIRRDVSGVGRLKSDIGKGDGDICIVSYSR